MRLNKYVAALSTAATLAAIVSAPVLAHQAGDFMVRVGATSVSPSSDKATINAAGMTVHLGTDATAATAPAITASVADNTQLGLNLVYFYSDQIAIELLAATPFSHDINVHSGGTTLNLGTTKHLPPTLSALYYLNDPSSKWQPYVGIGINYTVFFEEKFNPMMTGDAIEVGALGGASINNLAGALGLPADTQSVGLQAKNLKLKNSWGFAAQVGLDYQLDDRWLVNASARYIDIDTTGTFTATALEVPGKVDVSIDPWVYTLSASYKF